MKVFVATRDGQGVRESDFCDAEEGEVLFWSMECDRDSENLDGSCGCRRSLFGMETGGTTTTFAVADLLLPLDWYERQVTSFFSSKGYFEDNDELARLFREEAQHMLELAVEFKTGVVLEKRGNDLQIRQPIQKTRVSTTARKRRATKLACMTESVR